MIVDNARQNRTELKCPPSSKLPTNPVQKLPFTAVVIGSFFKLQNSRRCRPSTTPTKLGSERFVHKRSDALCVVFPELSGGLDTTVWRSMQHRPRLAIGGVHVCETYFKTGNLNSSHLDCIGSAKRGNCQIVWNNTSRCTMLYSPANCICMSARYFVVPELATITGML